MADITYMRGYGFPRGSAMDFAGYGGRSGGGFAGYIVDARRRMSAPSVPYVPEPSVYAKIPALDGYGGRGFGRFGSTFVMLREEQPLGDMNLPTLNVESGEWEAEGGVPETVVYGPEHRPELLGGGGGKGLMLAAAAAVGLFLLFRS